MSTHSYEALGPGFLLYLKNHGGGGATAAGADGADEADDKYWKIKEQWRKKLHALKVELKAPQEIKTAVEAAQVIEKITKTVERAERKLKTSVVNFPSKKRVQEQARPVVENKKHNKQEPSIENELIQLIELKQQYEDRQRQLERDIVFIASVLANL